MTETCLTDTKVTDHIEAMKYIQPYSSTPPSPLAQSERYVPEPKSKKIKTFTKKKSTRKMIMKKSIREPKGTEETQHIEEPIINEEPLHTAKLILTEEHRDTAEQIPSESLNIFRKRKMKLPPHLSQKQAKLDTEISQKTLIDV